MEILIINGSPRLNGNSSILINEVTKIFDEENVTYTKYQIGKKQIKGRGMCL